MTNEQVLIAAGIVAVIFVIKCWILTKI